MLIHRSARRFAASRWANASKVPSEGLPLSHVFIVSLALGTSACGDRVAEPELVNESCEQMLTCERALIGPVEAISTKADGRVLTDARVAGKQALGLEWIARGDSVDLIVTLPESPPLDARAFDGGLPTLASANNVAAMILGLNNSELTNEAQGGSETWLSPTFLSALSHGGNHAGCDFINNWPLVGSCTPAGYCCDQHDVCIHANCEPPFGNLVLSLLCLADPFSCFAVFGGFPSPSCLACHYQAIDCYLETYREQVGAPAHCCLEDNCGDAEQCIIPGDPAVPTEPGYAEPDPCECARNGLCPTIDRCEDQDVTDPCSDDHDPPPCSSCGDVHMRTPDGLAYDFQGAGEYLFVTSADGSIVVQVRQEPWRGSRLVSVNTAVAMNVNGDRVGVYLGRSPELYINGLPTEVANGTLDLVDGGHIHQQDHPSRTDYLVVWPNGFLTSVKLSGSYLDVGVANPEALQAGFRGLVGNLNGEAADDLRTRDETPLSSPILFDDLYRSFGDSWRVSATESIFDYEPGENTETFQLFDFPLRPATTAEFDQAAVQSAREICEAAGIEDPILLQDCILDVVATGDDEFVQSALDSELPETALEVVEAVNGGFDRNADRWFWENVNSEGGWQSTGGNPDGNFAINQAGEVATDPRLCQTVDGLEVGQNIRITGDYVSYAPGFGDPLKPNAFAVTFEGAVVLELPRPSPVSTEWTAFSTDLVTVAGDATMCFVAEREGDDSSFRVDNIALKGSAAALDDLRMGSSARR